ncbi:copper homeostasis protein [Paenibacillus sp. PCH8]|uniref:copper homeostasis protein CutC n=1 Tax=Paenibacillus sp. PCH8 TaxID=2066524 RepID=UPI000CF9BD50|nr:copper homeostasis protein CutC [Paenibacillus sp. PCH8]PQP83906.1 copper homeostasis protein [Paenibacillus sp. PCH8]
MKRPLNRQPVLEVIAVDAADARAAEQGGADRIELVSAMSEGGLTPSYGVMEQVLSQVSVPVYVMIRPHSRSFRYSADDIRAMTQDVRVARELGAAGIVIGALTEGGEVDLLSLQTCMSEAQGLGVTFHRAIDASASLTEAMETISTLGNIERVLTSGGKSAVPEGLLELKLLQELGQTLNTGVMAGSGVTIEGIQTIVSQTGITEIHMGSGVRREGSFDHPVDPQLVAWARQQLLFASQQFYEQQCNE